MNKKWLSFSGLVLILVLILGLSAPIIRSSADGAGGAGSGSGGSSSGGTASSGAFLSDDTAGYRMYFAPLTLSKGNPNFASNTYWELGTFQDIALYEVYNWLGATPAGGREIYGWHGSTGKGSKILNLGNFSSPFSRFNYSGSLAPIDFRNAIDDSGSNSFKPFKDLANQTLTDSIVLADLLTEYKNTVASFSLTASQQAQLDKLRSYNLEDLMLVFEPVFIACNNGSFNYTISYADYAYEGCGNLQAQDVSSRLINRVPKLKFFTTDFELNGVQYNPSGSGRWDGFAVFTNWMVKSKESKFSIGFNVNLQYNGGIERNLLTSNGVSSAVSQTETAPSQYADESNGTGNTNIGDARYMEALSNWEKLSSDYDANGYAIGRLYMSGLTWNNTMFNGNGSSIPAIPWEGANKSHSLVNIQQAVDSSMKSRIGGSVTDYVMGVYGNMTYANVSAITSNDLYVTNNTVVKLDVSADMSSTYSKPYANTSGLNAIKSKVASQAKAYTLEQLVQPDSGGLAFGSSFRVNFLMNKPDISSELGDNLKEVLTQGGFTITRASQVASLDAETTNTGYPVYQDNPAQVNEIVSRIQGATAYANAISTTGAEKSNEFKTGAGSAITMSVTSMSKKTPVDNYLASASVILQDNGTSAEYVFGSTGDTYSNTHLAQGKTLWYLNDESISTIGSAGENSENFVIVWKNADMEGRSNYDFSYSDRYNRAENIATALATYFTGHNPGGFNQGSTGVVSSAFKSTTGVTPVGVGYVGSGMDSSTTLSLGSAFTSSNELTGLSAMVLTISSESVGYNESADGLPAHMLNMVVPSVLGFNTNYNSIRPFNFQKKTYDLDRTWWWADWEVTHKLTGPTYDLSRTKLFYYNEDVGYFDESGYNPKTFTKDEKAYASYGYNITRAIWGDKPVISSFRGAGARTSYNTYFRNLGFEKGVVGRQTYNVGANVERQAREIKRDTIKFTAEVEWDVRKRDKETKEWYLDTRSSRSSKTYSVSHKMNKYTAMDLSTARVPSSSRNTLFDNNRDIGRSTTFGYYSAISDESSKILTAYPEVNMLMQYASSTIDTYSVYNVDNVYVMGEKARRLHPVALRGIVVGNQQFSGKFTSNTIATDKRAKALQGSDGIPVVYTGGNINLHTDKVSNKFSIVSYALDLADTASNGVSIKSGFSSSNNSYNPKTEHTTFVNSTLSNLAVDVTLDISTDRAGNNRLYSYNNFTTMMGNFSTSDVSVKEYALMFKNGDLYKSGSNGQGYKDLIADIASEYGVSSSEAKSIFNNSEIEDQLQRAFESGDDDSNMSSSTDDIVIQEMTGEDLSGESMYGDHWYDEQSSVFVVKKYKTNVTMGNVALSDKLDITLGNETVTSPLGGSKRITNLEGVQDRDSIFSKKAYGRWYMTLYLKNDIDLANGEVADDTAKEILWQEKYIKNADFIVSDATTNDMRN